MLKTPKLLHFGSFYEFAEVKPQAAIFSLPRCGPFLTVRSPHRVSRWLSRLAGHGEAGQPAVLRAACQVICLFSFSLPVLAVPLELGLVASAFVHALRVGTTFYPF